MDRILKAFVLVGTLMLVIVTTKGNSDPNDGPSSQNDDGHGIFGEPLSPEEFLEAEKILLHQSVPDNRTIDPTEKAGLFEGDIVLDNDDRATSYNGEKNAVTNPNHQWPNGVIPYMIAAAFTNDERLTIARAITEFDRQTCIQFKPRRTEVDYVFINTGNGCSSCVGRAGGAQEVTLGQGCVYVGIVMHELNHAVGFWHEQNRQDRDQFVTVHYENIQPGAEENFQKLPWSKAQNLSAQYDTSSIMHYGPFAFSRNRGQGKMTITPKEPNPNMGQRVNFTETDVYKINKLYGCRRTGRDTPISNSDQGQSPTTTTAKPSTTTTTTTTTAKPTTTTTTITAKPTTTTTTTTTTEKPDNCVDNHKDCERWANNDECRKNPNWMLVNCKKSCRQCKECTNDNQHCDYWAENGECSKNPNYMHVHCAKACKRC